jgi:glycerol-3-phosphate acyltransferase PlsY
MTFIDLLNNGFANLYIIGNGEVYNGMGIFLTVLAILLCCVAGYLIGSINFAIILSKKYNDDVRTHGSKNAGATNMLRTYGKKAALMTFLGDFLKAILVCFLGRFCWGILGAYLAGLFCVLGHVFPVFFKFKGGKGVSTTAGVMLACDVPTFLVIFVLYFGVFLASKFVSAASVMSALMYPFILFELNKLLPESYRVPGFCILLAMAISVVVVVKHIENIKRILNGTESKTYLFGKNKKAPEIEEIKEEKPKSLHNDD